MARGQFQGTVRARRLIPAMLCVLMPTVVGWATPAGTLPASPASAKATNESPVRPDPPPELLGWAGTYAESANGQPVVPPLSSICGSDQDTYLAELLHVPPTQAKVLREWADIVPGGKLLMVSGEVQTVHLGPSDLPMTHPYGYDLSMDVGLDTAYKPFSLHLGQSGAGIPGSLHVELSSGLIPHTNGSGTSSGTETWEQSSNENLSGFINGFAEPAIGDRVLVMGYWIIDCGHNDFGAELHPMVFLAWAHQSTTTTVVHFYYNPYRDLQLYSPDASVLGQVTNMARLSTTSTKPFPPYFVDEVLRLIGGHTDHLRSQELIGVNSASPVPWEVCVPTGSAKSGFVTRWDVVTRPGARFRDVANKKTACVTVDTQLPTGYKPVDASIRSCLLPWSFLNQVATSSIGMPVDVRQLVDKYIPQQFWPLVNRTPTTSCASALTGPVLPVPGSNNRLVDPSQPFPFYGVLEVARRK